MEESNSVPFNPPPTEHQPHPIPAWMVPLLSFPLRKLWENPKRLVIPLINPGDHVLELGPGSGFFTFPMAKAVGQKGKLFCVELQASVRRRLQRAAERRGLSSRVQVRACGSSELQLQDLAESVDLSVAIHVLHELPDPASAIRQMAASLRPGGQLMILEPKGHCPEAVFQAELHWAEQAGLTRMPDPWNLGARHQGALFRKM